MRITIHHTYQNGEHVFTSPTDCPGLLLAGRDFKKLFNDLHAAILTHGHVSVKVEITAAQLLHRIQPEWIIHTTETFRNGYYWTIFSKHDKRRMFSSTRRYTRARDAVNAALRLAGHLDIKAGVRIT